MGRDPACAITSHEEFRGFIHPDDADLAMEVTQTAAELIASGEDYFRTFRIVRPNGEIRWVRSAACVQHEGGVATRAIGFVMDITDARRGELALREEYVALEAERSSLARQNLEDALTGIANRRHLDLELPRICAEGKEAGHVLCVGMIDVDHFKSYNDIYGHPAGDAALRNVAKALQSIARQSDFVARYGGEEFAFVLRGVDDPAPVLERFVAAIADLAIVHEGAGTGYLTISCGCVVVESSADLPPASLLDASDTALYLAKRAGRNRFVVRHLDGQDGGLPT